MKFYIVIRAGILYRHGGIWLDADTIITSSDIRKIFDIEADFMMINAHLAFIKATMGGGIRIYLAIGLAGLNKD